MGRRSEPTPSGDRAWYTMNDSQIKPAETSLLARNPPEKLVDDNAYMFSSCVANRLRGRLSCESLCHSLTMSRRRAENSEAPGQQENFDGFTASIVSSLWANLVRAHGMLSSDSNRASAE